MPTRGVYSTPDSHCSPANPPCPEPCWPHQGRTRKARSTSPRPAPAPPRPGPAQPNFREHCSGRPKARERSLASDPEPASSALYLLACATAAKLEGPRGPSSASLTKPGALCCIAANPSQPAPHGPTGQVLACSAYSSAARHRTTCTLVLVTLNQPPLPPRLLTCSAYCSAGRPRTPCNGLLATLNRPPLSSPSC